MPSCLPLPAEGELVSLNSFFRDQLRHPEHIFPEFYQVASKKTINIGNDFIIVEQM